MNHQAYAFSAYNAALLTTPPLTAVVMLYDGVLLRIANATVAAKRQDYEVQFNEAMKAATILNSLDRYLDMERGGRVAISLREMYQAVVKALLSSVGRSTGDIALERIGAAVRLTRDAWAEIAGMPISTGIPLSGMQNNSGH
jgi:flagellar protein FliS